MLDLAYHRDPTPNWILLPPGSNIFDPFSTRTQPCLPPHQDPTALGLASLHQDSTTLDLDPTGIRQCWTLHTTMTQHQIRPCYHHDPISNWALLQQRPNIQLGPAATTTKHIWTLFN
jgi:hypothetical protein